MRGWEAGGAGKAEAKEKTGNVESDRGFQRKRLR